jgi:hypothetical protein
VLAYVKAHGGGTLALSSQTGAASAIITKGAAVGGIGGFSGRESQVSLAWMSSAVQSGRIRWVLGDTQRGFGRALPGDTRTGATDVMAVVAKACKKISVSSSTLYDCQGSVGRIAAGGR